MAHSIGFYAAHTYLRIQSITHTASEKAGRLDQLKIEQPELSGQSAQPSEQAAAQEAKQAATMRAEEMVNSLTQHLSSLMATVKLNAQRSAARVREDAEDMWAEARTIQHHMH